MAITPQAVATLRLFISAARISWLPNAWWYHFVVRPASGNAATVESLNEKMISSAVGTYRKIRNATKNAVSARLPLRDRATLPPAPLRRGAERGALGAGVGNRAHAVPPPARRNLDVVAVRNSTTISRKSASTLPPCQSNAPPTKWSATAWPNM